MNRSHLIIIAIIVLAGFFRIYGLNWDQNNHLHPDERFLTMVALAMKWPSSIPAYLDTTHSQLNPHNIGYPFYVYGTLPVVIVKYFADIFNLGNYDTLTLVGRVAAAIMDLGTVLLVYLITLRLVKKTTPALLASFTYALSVLPIQLSHFFAVDTFIVFFLTATFYFLVLILSETKFKKLIIISALMGLTFGLALSSKITAGLFLPIITLGFINKLFKSKKIFIILTLGLCFGLFSYFSLRFAQPYLFADANLLSFHLNPKLIANWQELKKYDDPNGYFPPAVQWVHTQPFLFPLENNLYWGLGLPFGLLAIFSVIYFLFVSIKLRQFALILIPLWIIFLFSYQSLQFAKPLRYFYPIYPFLAISSGLLLYNIFKRFSKLSVILIILVLFIWPVAFISIYSRPHPRIAATTWIYQHIPPGSNLSCEYWDDCLPLGGSGPYTAVEYHLYDTESLSKWTTIINQLDQTDYIILSSSRLYGSIMTVPEKYPETIRFYQALFGGRLGFTKIAEFTSRPNLSFPGISACLSPPFLTYGWVAKTAQVCPLSGLSFVDDYSDETLTVYDHPKVIIFHKTAPVDYASILSVPKI